MKDENIISVTNDPQKSFYITLIQSHNILVEKIREHPNMTINASMYVKDIGFLIRLTQYYIEKDNKKNNNESNL